MNDERQWMCTSMSGWGSGERSVTTIDRRSLLVVEFAEVSPAK